MSDLSTRLKESRKRSGKSQAALAEEVGMKQPSYQALESGKSLKSSFLPLIAQALNVDPIWLQTGNQDKPLGNFNMQDFMGKHNLTQRDESGFDVNDIQSPIIVEYGDGNEFIWIDVVEASFSCGDGESIEFHFDVINGKQPFAPNFFYKRGIDPVNVKIIKAKGDSMAERIFDGDLVGIDMSQTNIIDGEIYAVYFAGEGMIKQVFKEADGSLILHSLNDKYRDKVVTEENGGNFKVMGRQIWRAG